MPQERRPSGCKVWASCSGMEGDLLDCMCAPGRTGLILHEPPLADVLRAVPTFWWREEAGFAG